ncbi:MAG: hypothetical protein JWO51_3551 [Rhodospirillales bacterium]|nr:hypothetical protein [Rhodospirillales bacterium]
MGNPMDRLERKRFVKTLVRPTFAAHELIAPPPTKSWRLQKPGRWDYSFAVVWTPGRLQISGDIGTCAYEGPTFFRAWPEAAEAVITCDFDYLTGKSEIRPVYDQEATCRDIFHMMAEEAVRARKYERHERQDARRKMREAEHQHREGYLQDGEYGPIWIEPDLPPMAITERPRPRRAWIDERRFDVPDGWEALHRLQQVAVDHLDVNDIFTHDGREALKNEISNCCESHDGAAELCSRLGLDDYYGTSNLPSSASWHFEAIQTWARLVVQTDEFEREIIVCRARQRHEAAVRSFRDQQYRQARRYDQTIAAVADDDGMPVREVA